MAKQPKKIYIVRKYILAKDAKEALRLDKVTPVDDVWAEDATHKEYLDNQIKNVLGFK